MKKRILFGVILGLVSLHPAWADQHESKAQMEMLKAEFSKCMMCKNYVPVFDELMPVLQTEFVRLDNGMVITTGGITGQVHHDLQGVAVGLMGFILQPVD